MDPIPLSGEDRAILELESDTIAGHTCKVVVIDGAPAVDELRSAISARLDLAPGLRRRLGGTGEEPVWVEAEVAIAMHVVRSDGPPLDGAGLRDAVADLFAQRLSRDRPLWRMDLLALDGERSALVWRIHHALADGTTAMRYARELLFDTAKPTPGGAPHARKGHAEDDARRRGHLAAFLRREFSTSREASPFDGSVGTRREVAFATAPIAELHDAAKSLAGATLNDAVLSVLAGALRTWMGEQHGSLGDLRVKVPVSLHHEGEDAANRDSFFTLPLPLNEADPVERLRLVHAATATRKHEHDAQAIDALHRGLERISPRLEAFSERIERSPRRFALNVSNVPGPREPVAVLGAPVSELYSLAEIGEHHALRVAVVSCGGELGFGICADPAIVTRVGAMADATGAEVAALVEAGASAG